MSHQNRRSVAGLRLSIVGSLLFLLTTIAGSLTVWSALARPRGLEAATHSTTHSPRAEMVAALPLEQPARQPAFTITWEGIETSAEGQSRLLHTTTRYQRSDGIYKFVRTYPARAGDGGRALTYFGYAGLGLFYLDEARDRLIFITPQSDEQSEDLEAALRADPLFDREEDVRGQRVLVLRTHGEDSAIHKEEYRAPALGGIIVKSVESSPRGREVWEPTSIELGEPTASLFAGFERYAPDYTRYERKIQRMERDPQQAAAARIMRQLLRRMRTVRPDAR